MDWLNLAQDRDQWKAVIHMPMNLRIPQNTGKFLSSCTAGGFSRKAQLHWCLIKVSILYNKKQNVDSFLDNCFLFTFLKNYTQKQYKHVTELARITYIISSNHLHHKEHGQIKLHSLH
jgi:hypothetical protein